MGKKVLGLDLGTNSIGWALVNYENNTQDEKFAPDSIIKTGSRIIPMDAAAMNDFDSGNLKSQTSVRTGFRSIRRLVERHLLRRERLHRVLNVLGFLPVHYKKEIDFEQRLGQFKPNAEPKIAYFKNEDTGRFDFYFMESFHEMLNDFKQRQPDLVKDEKKVPYDWTIYYLRKKALIEKISKYELAWLLLNFNQKRGYYEQRGDEEDIDQTKVYDELMVLSIEDSGDHKNGGVWYNVSLGDGGIYKKFSKTPLDWVGKTKEFIITYKVDKAGNESRSYSIPSRENDWTLIKKRTEKQIADTGKSVGSYIYDTLLSDPSKKIKGKLIQTIERDLYRKELTLILNKQKEFHPELCNEALYLTAINELYRSNQLYRDSIAGRDFTYLFVSDIIFYQRPLKSKRSQIDDCRYEKRAYKNPKTGEIDTQAVKCIAKSHPLFEEFRLWQLLANVKIMEVSLGKDVTGFYLKDEDAYVELFDKLKYKKEVDQKSFLRLFKLKEESFKWNYGDKALPVSPTRYEIINRLGKLDVADSFVTEDMLEHLWHILYSVSDKKELESALKTFALKNGLDADAFISEFKKVKPFDKDYGSYSAKAIKKLLPLMRMGKYWSEEAVTADVRQRIDKIINGEADEQITERAREKLASLSDILYFRGLPLWLACYAVYGKHSEAMDTSRWTSPDDIDTFLKEFKQHSLRNPIVEQVITETLRLVRDVWKQYGEMSEIHIELGREMKNPKDKRVALTRQNQENELTNLRIKALLAELRNDNPAIRPESPAQQERLKLYEEGVWGSDIEVPEDIQKISRQRQPSKSDIIRYKCWLEQGYCSPYTGRPIPLGQLFSSAYEIEHVIPQARYFDDSLSNKIICESSVNKEKKDMLAYEFISRRQNLKIDLGGGTTVTLLSPDEYESFIKRNFKNSHVKRKKLMMDEIPDQFIERQMNDTRYISKYVRNLLSNIVREEGEEEAISKNVISLAGAITSKLKEDWGLNDVWNKLVTPRFVRLNHITKSDRFGQWVDKHTFRTTVPDEFAKGYSKKRIDHRHHAMDALVIACATRSHINYLSNESAKERGREGRLDLRKNLCRKNNQGRWIFEKPYERFTQDAQLALENIIVSFKQNLRIINKSTNKYQRFEDGKKVMVKQVKGDNWAIRKPLHKDTVFGLVNLQMKKEVKLATALDTWHRIADKNLRAKVKSLIAEGFEKKQLIAHFKQTDYRFDGKDISKVEVYYYTGETEGVELVATRKPLDISFDAKRIESVTDSGIRQILSRHLADYDGNAEEAFSPDGIDRMNDVDNLTRLNEGKPHKPIYKVRVYETRGNKFRVGERGCKDSKYVEAAKGTNLFFAIYTNADSKRTYETVPLEVAIQNAKDGLDVAPQKNEKGDTLLFVLSPNDLVYVPTVEQLERGKVEKADIEGDKNRVYKIVSFTGGRLYAIPYYVAVSIADKKEYTSLNKSEFTIDTNESIREYCILIKVNTLAKYMTKI